MSNTINGKEVAPSIDVKNLSYAFPDGSSGLKDVFLDLPPGSRTLLIGGM
jgi:CCR4-NOT complex subunit CAF16